MGFFHKIKKAVSHVAHEVVHEVTHPQEVIKTAVKGISNVGHGLDDIVHGDFKHGIGEVAGGLKNTLDPAHIVGMSHQLARPITDPVNKAMAGVIKGVIGHNVLGSHPLNTVGTVVAGVVTGGAASALVEGATLAGAAAAGVGALESAGSTILGGLGTGLSAVGMDAAGSTVSTWSSELAAAAAGNASTAAASVGTGNWISHTVDAVKQAGHAVSDAVSSAEQKVGSSLSHIFGTEAPKSLVTGGNTVASWSPNLPSSTFNGGIGAQGLGPTNAIAPIGQNSTNAGTVFSNLSRASAQTGDTMGFGFGDYYDSAASGAAGHTIGQGGIQAVERSALGSGITGNPSGFSGLADAATGRLGTGGVGLYGETAEGVIEHSMASSGATNLFNYGANYAVPNSWNDALKSASNSNSNKGFSSPSKPAEQSKGGSGSGFKDALSQASGLKLDVDLGDQFKVQGQNLEQIDTSGLDIDQFKPQSFSIANNYAPVQFTDY